MPRVDNSPNTAPAADSSTAADALKLQEQLKWQAVKPAIDQATSNMRKAHAQLDKTLKGEE